MNRIFWAALAVCLLVAGGVSLANEIGYSDGYDAGYSGYACNGGDPWMAVPQPSGMRFTPAGGSTGMPCSANYNYCWAEGGCMHCAHWTQYSWYAPWPHAPRIEHPHKRHYWLH